MLSIRQQVFITEPREPFAASELKIMI
jgi:hypothetical protein